jgi:hypothetical protein
MKLQVERGVLMPAPVRCTVRRAVAAPVERTFAEVVAEDVLPKVLHRYRAIPAVVGTAGNTGSWDVPGSQRRIVFSDGGSAREEVTEWVEPERFAYRVDRFTNLLGRLVTRATGAWWFTPAPGGSAFTWTYEFHPRNRMTRPITRAFVRILWTGYMAQCADLCVELAELPRPGAPGSAQR